MPGNTYQLVETQEPDGFYCPTGYWIVTVTTNGEITIEVEGEAPEFDINDKAEDEFFFLINNPINITIEPVPLEFIKTNQNSLVPLKGAVFHIYERNSEDTDWKTTPMATVTSGDNPTKNRGIMILNCRNTVQNRIIP